MHSVTLAVFIAFCMVAGTFSQEVDEPSVNGTTVTEAVRQAASQLAETTLSVVRRAKAGTDLGTLRSDIESIKVTASELTRLTEGQVSDDDVNAVVHAMTSGSKSPEMLQVLIGEDSFAVLSGRLVLSLDYLETAAKQLKNALSESDNPVIEPLLAAVVFGADSVLNVITQAAEAMSGVAPGAFRNGWRKDGDRIFWRIAPKAISLNVDHPNGALRSIRDLKRVSKDICICIWCSCRG